MKKYHTISVNIKSGVCDINFENETGLQEHNKSRQQKADVLVLEIQREEDLKMEVDTNDTNPNSENEKISVQVLEGFLCRACLDLGPKSPNLSRVGVSNRE